LRCFRSRPYLAVGWFWYLGTLVPVIGLVQVGIQARADRYTYVPSVGLAIMLAWGAADAVRHWSPVMPRLRVWVSVAATLILLALALVAWRQVQYWQSGETLFRHTIAVTGPNPKAWQNLGTALLIEHRTSDAIAAYEGGLRVDSNDADLHCNLAVTLMTQDLNANFPRAVDHLRTALRIDPNSADAHSNLAVALSKTGHLAQAVEEDRAVVRIRPDSAAGHADLAAVLYTAGQWSEAIEEAKTALRIDPDSAAAHCALAASLLALNTEPSEEAVEHLRQALRIQPDYVEALANLGVALARIPGATFESIFEFEEALRIDPAYRPAQIDLGFSLAQIPGRRREALAHLRIALRLRPDPKLQQKLEQIESAPSPAEQ
jgi:tetratricopeptide (TPR) repeat protein